MENVISVSSKKATDKRGFTLVEALIAVTLLAICAWALFASLQAGITLASDVRDHITASCIIQREVEIVRKTAFASLADKTFTTSLLENASGSVDVQQYSTGIPTSEMVRVVITLTWTSRLNPSKQYTKRIATLVTKNGINAI